MRKMKDKEVKEKRIWENVEGVDGMITFFKRNEVSSWRNYDDYECIHTISKVRWSQKRTREKEMFGK